MFPVVGIGASAGGLAAFEAFFSAMAKDDAPGMAYVLVQHLAPDHESALPDILRRFTAMPVTQAADGTVVAVNNVYVNPPGWDLAIVHGTLRLMEPAVARAKRLPIDSFFRSLAQDRQETAIAIVLSGTGSDGAKGVHAIKDAGGLVLAQSPNTTEFDGMPRAALATGAVDQELHPQEMPARLAAFARHVPFDLSLAGERPEPGVDNALRRIFAYLRAKTGHDFTHYKPTTVRRRIQRRMAVHQIETLDSYGAYLQQAADEAQELFRDLLIGVTSFFRDPEAFRVLEDSAMPALVAGRAPGRPLRLWVAGCSTGEETYSIAMLLLEQLDEPATPQVVQIFATDIDPRAVAAARAGLYPESIAGALTPERLERHFKRQPDGSGYRVRKTLRDMVIFSEHDLTRDPPFSKIDLISCRNLLIYLDGTLQKRIIPLFHYALRPEGLLFLGTSESIGTHDELFKALDRKAKLFRRLAVGRGALTLALHQVLKPPEVAPASPEPQTKEPTPSMKTSLRALTERAILGRLSVVAALVNGPGDILYLHGRAGMYLEPTPGDAGTNNILAMARDGLRSELSLALSQTVATRRDTVVSKLRVKTNGHYTLTQLSVSPVAADARAPTEQPLFLVLLEPVPASEVPAPPLTSADPGLAGAEINADARLEALTEALRKSEEQVQSMHEELESSVEELTSSNEEMQSVNEELQSTNEELETSKEELQSVNEELSTVNTELETKVSDLSRANDDMNNLIAGTGIATVFVDHGLRILRFTPGASEIINLIASDVGRPVGHLASNLDGYDSLSADTQTVLDTLVPKAHDVRTKGGRSYSMRIQPYRTIDNFILGAVITFVDITEAVRTRLALKKANSLLRLAVVVRDAFDAVTVNDLEGRTLAWNPAATTLYGWTEPEALRLNFRERVPAALQTDAMADLRRLAQAEVQEAQRTQRLAKDGRYVDVWVKATAVENDDGQIYAIATTERPAPSAAEQG